MTSKILRITAAADRSGGLTQKFERLLEKADLSQYITAGDTVAVKMHFGEPGNARYIRPIFPVLLVDKLKELGARPFVTDTAVLYKSLRHQAWEYYQVARRHGFTSEVLGCPLVISGGFSDRSVKVRVKEPMRMDEVGISTEIHDANALISLAHVTLHLLYPIGAALKNVGMGCVDIDTKLAMHDARGTSPRHLALQEATCDGAKTIVSGFEGKFFAINLLLDITPDCDCFERSDLPVVPDLGILAGTDPVALDKASYDMILEAPGYPGSKLEGSGGMAAGGDKVQPIYPRIDPEAYFQITQRSGIGSTSYEILEV